MDPESYREGQKIRHDTFKGIATASLLVNGGFVAFVRTVVEKYPVFGVLHFWLATGTMASLGFALAASVVGSEGVARSMRGEESRANRFVRVMMILAITFLIVGIMLLWIYGIHYAFFNEDEHSSIH